MNHRKTTAQNRGKIKKHLISIFFLVFGLVLMYLGDNGCFPKELMNRGLREFGLFLSVSVVSHFIYTLTIKKEDQAELRSILDEQAYFKSNGLHKIHSNFSYNLVFDSLKKDDKLCWLVTWVPDFFNYTHSFQEALGKGASIQLLAIDPHSRNAKNRVNEIASDWVHPPREDFTKTIKQTIKELELQKLQLPGKLEVHVYEDLPGIPMFLVKRKDKPIVVYTGVYVNKHLSQFIFLEWRHSEHDESNTTLNCFQDYFSKKWTNSEPLGEHNPWLGKWNYKASDDHDNKILAFGTCEFVPGNDGEFKVKNGIRTHKTKKVNNEYPSEPDIANWNSSKDFFVEKKEEQVSILFNFEVNYGEGNAKGVFDLTYNPNKPNSPIFKGTFHIYNFPDKDQSDMTDGKIDFTKEQLDYTDSKLGKIKIIEAVKDQGWP